MSTTRTLPPARPFQGHVGHRRADGSVYWTHPEELPTPGTAWAFAHAHRAAAEVRITDRTGEELLLLVEDGRLAFPTEAEGLSPDFAADFAGGTLTRILHAAGEGAGR